MKMGNKIIYWISTIWLAVGMLSSGIVQLLNVKREVEFILDLGYPVYFLKLLGALKIFAVIVILIPKYPLLKEWAYAGFFFAMTGAIFSHIATSNPMNEIFPALLLLVLTGVSWYFRPTIRKLSQTIQINHG